MKYLIPEVIKNKRILMRVDFNVDLDEKGNVIDDFRIQRILPTINFLKENQAKTIVLMSHLGQPETQDFWTEKFTLKPIADYLERILKEKIFFISVKNIQEIKKIIDASNEGVIYLLENLRYYEGEEKNDKNFAFELSQLGDVYINEAFSVSHRQAASLCALTEFLPSYPGFLLKEEIENLDKFINNSESPIVIILGGAKVKDKLPLIKVFAQKADWILVGGVVANTILKAWDFKIGNSKYEEQVIEDAKNVGSQKAELVLPGDYYVLTKNSQKLTRELGRIEKEDNILDIGPVAALTFRDIIKKAKTIFFNGPLGKIEDQRFQDGTKQILEAIIQNQKAKTIIGGGDTLMAFRILKPQYEIKNTEQRFFSTGGGAMLKYLAGESLPALEALEKSKI